MCAGISSMPISTVRETMLARSQPPTSTEFRLRNVSVNSIRIGRRLRPLGDISSLVESIREVGLLSPISVTRDKCLISGLHRLEAFRALGRKYIPAFIVPISPQEAKIAEIDENLARNDLSLLERAEHLYRRKQIYEGMHPERRHGGNRGNQYTGGKKCQDANLQFCQTVAAASGRSATSVHRLVRIAKLLTAETKQLLRGSEWANNQQTLMKLCKLTPEMQEGVAAKVAKGESKEIADAIAKVKRDRLRASGCATPEEDANYIIDVNVLAVELLRQIQSSEREEKLKQITESLNYLNPTLRKQLVSALRHTAASATKFERQLSKDFRESPTSSKAFQRKIRERMALMPEPDEELKREAASSFANAHVREITKEEAAAIILRFEWLANAGTGEFAVGLFFTHPKTGQEFLGGVAVFGRTAGSNAARAVCGEEHADKVLTLVRGACAHWTDPPRTSSDGRTHSGGAASYLINRACELMFKRGFTTFLLYSDIEAGEIGTVAQAAGWIYTGTTNATEKFRTPSGEVKDARLVSAYTRDRTGGKLRYKRTRSQQKQILLEEGCEFFRGLPKHRYVHFAGTRREKRILRNALKWEALPYPKRKSLPEYSGQTLDLDPAEKALAASTS